MSKLKLEIEPTKNQKISRLKKLENGQTKIQKMSGLKLENERTDYQAMRGLIIGN